MNKTITKWNLENNPLIIRRMGKTTEELNELGSVTARIVIQGIDEIDPSSQKVNRERLIEEMADVYAQLDANIEMLGLDNERIQERRLVKLGLMREWEDIYK